MPRDLVEARKEVDQKLASADPALYRQISSARAGRPVRDSQPRVVIHPDEVKQSVDGLTPAPGTVTLYWARRGSDILRQLADAMVSGDVSGVADRFQRIAKAHTQRRVSDVKSAVGSMLEAPSFFDLRYGKRTLAANLWIDDSLELASLVMPFAGGDLDAGDFEMLEYPNPDNPEPCPWDPLVVVRRPKLSDIERRVLEAVPSQRREMLIGPSDTVMATPTALLTVAVFVTINTAVTTCCGAFRDRLAEVILTPDAVRGAAEPQSVTELVQRRAEVLTQFGVR